MFKYPKYSDIIGTGSGPSRRAELPIPVPEHVSDSDSDDEVQPLEELDATVRANHILQLAGSPHIHPSTINPMEWIHAHTDFSLRRHRPEYTQHHLNATIDDRIADRRINGTVLNPQDTRFIMRVLAQRPP